MRGAVSSGHPLTTDAACHALALGGNAFDAVISAAFAATVAEPCLTSLGGGGFLLSHEAATGTSTISDFFVDSPGKGLSGGTEPHFEPVDVMFTGTAQVFHVGLGSVAVPGMLKGLVECYGRLCTLEVDDIIAPALRLLQEGVESNPLQQYLSRILMPILSFTDYGRSIYEATDRGGRLFNPLYREFLLKRDPGAWMDVFYGSGAAGIDASMRKAGGLVTERDMREYSVNSREPLRFQYRGRDIVTNAAPSFGGELLQAAFEWLSGKDMDITDPVGRAALMAGAMSVMNQQRQVAGGTTHISVLDELGNAASLTSSNGSNSGCFLDGTGVMFNNMMGEDDLHPAGFHGMPPGLRVGSMMSPSLIMSEGKVRAVLGSGGSKRIRTAMFQVIHNLVDRGLDPMEAVEDARMHLDDDGTMHMEPGFPVDVPAALRCDYALNEWSHRDLYFGGVHIVTSSLDGWGDSRRGGSFKKV